MAYSDYEFEIFSRQFILKEFSEDKIAKLEKSKVTIIGVGGIGCPLSTYLISSGIKNLLIIDGDKVEKSNLNRQILYSSENIGEKKVEVAKNKLLKINPYAKIDIIYKNLNEKNINAISDSSIVIDTTDNWKTMKIINQFCVKNYLPLISASITGFDIEVSLFKNNKENHLCLNCIFPNTNDVDLPRCEVVGVSGIGAGIAGLISAQKTVNFLLSLKPEYNILSMYNVLNGEFNNIILKNDQKCYLNY